MVMAIDGNLRSTVMCHRLSHMAVLAVNTKTGEAATQLLTAPCRRDCALYVKEVEDCADKLQGLLALKTIKLFDAQADAARKAATPATPPPSA
jgi:hypothetical protein